MRFAVLVAALAACGPAGTAPSDGSPGGSDGPHPPGDGMVPPTSHVQIIVEPSHGTELATAIAGAHSSVYMTMYEISDQHVIDALVARASAGLDVQAVLDSSPISKSFNMDAYNQLSAAGVKVVWSSSAFTYTHEKCVIIDDTQAWIMTMNTNTSSPTSNREYLAIDTDPADIAEATAVFKADHALQAITPTGSLVVANANARAKLVALINGADHMVDVEGEEFSDTSQGGIVDALVAAAARGITVRVVVANDTSVMASETTAINRVKAAGVQVVMSGPTSSNGTLTNPYIHAKTIVVDCGAGSCAAGFVGSENFSAGSLSYNRELGVIFSVPGELAKIESAIDSDFSRGVAQ